MLIDPLLEAVRDYCQNRQVTVEQLGQDITDPGSSLREYLRGKLSADKAYASFFKREQPPLDRDFMQGWNDYRIGHSPSCTAKHYMAGYDAAHAHRRAGHVLIPFEMGQNPSGPYQTGWSTALIDKSLLYQQYRDMLSVTVDSAAFEQGRTNSIIYHQYHLNETRYNRFDDEESL